MTSLQWVGLALVGLGIALLAVAAYGASQTPPTSKSQPFLEWLWGQLTSIITDLIGASKKWFERVAALGKISLLLGLAFVFSPVFLGESGSGASQQPSPDSTVSPDSAP
jgi:hypothetical protein